MRELLVETRRQAGRLERYTAAMLDVRLIRWLLLLAVLTSIGWATGSLVYLIDLLPEWALMLVAMPLFGSAIAVYTIGGLSALSLLLSISLDIVAAPFRRHDGGRGDA